MALKEGLQRDPGILVPDSLFQKVSSERQVGKDALLAFQNNIHYHFLF